jgi:hypothetical protein
MLRLFLILVLVIGLVGCGGSKDEIVPLEQVPENVMKAARKKRPELTYERQARKKANGVWVIKGKEKNGKTREFEIDSNGNILEEE